LSWTLLFSGYPEQALRSIGEATADAGHLSHFNTLAYALIFSAAVQYERRNRQATQERSEALISLCTDQRLFFWLGAAHCLHGWALASGGHSEDGIAELNQGIAAYRATGGELFMPFLLAVHTETRQKAGHSGEGSLDLLNEALARTSMTGERCYEAELHRLRGECVLSLASRNQAAAETSFQQAIEIARHQGAKMWELRGAASLARLWLRQGRCAQARDLLTPICGWFTEGLDARDLAEARELLHQLE
jgi:predicted ATPase